MANNNKIKRAGDTAQWKGLGSEVPSMEKEKEK